jgi:hypothetical protein
LNYTEKKENELHIRYYKRNNGMDAADYHICNAWHDPWFAEEIWQGLREVSAK